MALIAKIKTSHGIEIQTAYLAIASTQIYKQVVSAHDAPPVNQFTLRINVSVYASEQARVEGLPAVETLDRVYQMGIKEPVFSQAYGLLQAEFGGIPA